MSNSEGSEKEFIPTKKLEYEDFISNLEEGVPLMAWKDVAKSYGVDKDTITSWANSPRGIKARREALKQVDIKRRASGKDDWRMWDRQARLHGMDVADKLELSGKLDVVNLDNLDKDKLAQLKSIIEQAGIVEGNIPE
jgi:hypothetical protein